MQRVFVTSDTHFGHANIIAYCNRPFIDVHDMNAALIERWNSVVDCDDIVYHLGDFAFANPDFIRNIIGRLNGGLVLVPGNHDRSMHKLYKQNNPPFMMASELVELKIEDKEFVLCHFPLEEWKSGAIHLHGHTHGKSLKMENRFDIGIDVYGRPVQIGQDITSLLNPKGW